MTTTSALPSSAGAHPPRAGARSERAEVPVLPSGQITLQPPPGVDQRETSGGMLLNLVPMLGSLGAVVLLASIGTSGGQGTALKSMLTAGLLLFAMLGFVFVQVERNRRQRAQQVSGTRTDYLRYLANVRRIARDAGEQQRRAMLWHHPAPHALPALAEDRTRLWERAPGDPRFLTLRYGVSTQPLALELVAPDPAVTERADPVATSALQRLLAVHRHQPDLPTSLDLTAFATVAVLGADDDRRSLARALVCSGAALQGPEHLAVAVLCAPEQLPQWDWLKWLPHNHSGRRSDAIGPMRMVSSSFAELAALLPADLAERSRFGAEERAPSPHLLLVLDGAAPPLGNHVIPLDGVHGVTVLSLQHPGAIGQEGAGVARLLLGAPGASGVTGAPDQPTPVRVERWQQDPVDAVADACDLATAEAFARRLAPLGDGAAPTSSAVGGPADFGDLLGIGDVRAYDPERAWHRRPARDRLRVPIGVGDGGVPVPLDLKESAQQGMGPHGLVVGATGSGKSEFLRTLVLGLTMTHSPEELNLVLVDFKGGATFAGMAAMPHVSAVITNLADDLTLVDRMQDALAGEMMRRQEALRDAGNLQSVRDYERARTSGDPAAESRPPLPSLVIVVDEFSELLSVKPEFVDLFGAIGRLGRSLGLHLLLASQRLEEGRLRGLDSHLSYRIGLRTNSAAESRAVLGVPDAHELPGDPGVGYLKTDPATMLRFRAGYVSGPAPRATRAVERAAAPRGILPFTIAEVPDLSPPEPHPAVASAGAASGTAGESEGAGGDSVLDLAVSRMSGRGPRAHRVWLPPLERPETLDRLLGDLAEDSRGGLVSARWRDVPGLVVPLGVVDRPREQRREVLAVDLAGAGGHAAVVGGPVTGKSTLLRSLVTSLALTTTPLESQFFALDFGGGSFASLAGLPHVSGVAGRSEPDVVRRIVAEVTGVLDRREQFFREHGLDSMAAYRSRRRPGAAGTPGEAVDDGYGDVYLVVDGWGTLRTDFEEVEQQLQALAARGLTFGVHLLAAATRWGDFRAAVRDLFGTRLELKLGDPIDSEVDRKIAASVPAGRPGRGLTSQKLHFLAALPRIDGDDDPATGAAGSSDLVERVAAAWSGPTGPKLRLLPERITLESVRTMAGAGGDRLLLGVDEHDLAPVTLDPGAEPHLLVFGDGQSGKSALLRTLSHEVVRTRTPKQAQIVVVDYRRSLLGEAPDDYQLHYLTNASQAVPALQQLASYLENRIPGPDVVAEQLRTRSWWSGAEVFVLVDDYDLVATGQSSPLAPLVPLLAQARDVGLHLWVARRSGGASRAIYEPVVQALRELAMPGLLLSGSPDEGQLIGTLRPAPSPPGRGRLLTREHGVRTVQCAWLPESY